MKACLTVMLRCVIVNGCISVKLASQKDHAKFGKQLPTCQFVFHFPPIFVGTAVLVNEYEPPHADAQADLSLR